MKLVTRENEKTVVDFQKHVGKNLFIRASIAMLIILILGIICLIFKSTIIGIFLVFFAIFYELIFPFVLKNANKKLNESNHLMTSDKIVELEFETEKFTLKCYQNNEMINSSTYYYDNLFKVEEIPTYFYLYIGNNQAICIDKADLDSNDINELKGILQAHISKYKVLKF